MGNVALLTSLQNLSFDKEFKKIVGNVALPSGLQSMNFGSDFTKTWAMWFGLVVCSAGPLVSSGECSSAQWLAENDLWRRVQ